ncbi:hypothetical protein AH06_77 [Erwinia phage AH06]|nr:hypothetical protein AH06_77 [Erwinia phage AH06]
MLTAKKANKSLGEHAASFEAINRSGKKTKAPKKAKWTIGNVGENLVVQGIVSFLKNSKTLKMREVNEAAIRITKIMDAQITINEAKNFVASVIGYRNYDAINVEIRTAIPVRNKVQQRKAAKMPEERLDDGPLTLIEKRDPGTDGEVKADVLPTLYLLLTPSISKGQFRRTGKAYRDYINQREPEHYVTLMQAYNHVAKCLGYPSYHEMPRVYPLINLNAADWK